MNAEKIVLSYGRKKVGDPVIEFTPGANTDATRTLLETTPANIVYCHFTSGDDTTGDGSSGNPFKTYSKGVTEVGASAKTHVGWMDSTTITDNITVPTQTVQGVTAAIGGSSVISANINGFTISTTAVTISADITIQHCSFTPSTGVGLTTTNTLTLDRCKIVSEDDHALSVTKNFLILQDSLVYTKAASKNAVRIVGAAATSGDIQVEFCTIAASSNTETAVYIDNDTGGAGNEIVQNVIIEGKLEATEATNTFQVDSGNIRGTLTNISAGSNVTVVDPLFIDKSAYDFRIQRESGYSDTDDFDFNSPLVGAAIDHTTANLAHLNSVSEERDFGAYSYDDSAVEEIFTKSARVRKPERFQLSIVNNANVHASVSGDYDVYNDINRRSEQLSITWAKGLDRDEMDVFEQIERYRDTSVFVSFDAEDRTALPTITVNGNQSAGEVVLDITALNIWPGVIFSIGSVEYHVLYTLDASNVITQRNVTQLVLSQPLQAAVTNGQSITPYHPEGLGTYIYIPGTRTYERQMSSDKEYLRGFTANFIRKKE